MSERDGEGEREREGETDAYSFVRKVAWGFVSDFAGTDCCGVGSFLGGEWGVEGSGGEGGAAGGLETEERLDGWYIFFRRGRADFSNSASPLVNAHR